MSKRAPFTSASVVECYQCGGRGHRSFECPHRPTNNKHKQDKQASNDNQNEKKNNNNNNNNNRQGDRPNRKQADRSRDDRSDGATSTSSQPFYSFHKSGQIDYDPAQNSHSTPTSSSSRPSTSSRSRVVVSRGGASARPRPIHKANATGRFTDDDDDGSSSDQHSSDDAWGQLEGNDSDVMGSDDAAPAPAPPRAATAPTRPPRMVVKKKDRDEAARRAEKSIRPPLPSAPARNQQHASKQQSRSNAAQDDDDDDDDDLELTSLPSSDGHAKPARKARQTAPDIKAEIDAIVRQHGQRVMADADNAEHQSTRTDSKQRREPKQKNKEKQNNKSQQKSNQKHTDGDQSANNKQSSRNNRNSRNNRADACDSHNSVYPPYYSADQLSEGQANHRLLKGTLRCMGAKSFVTVPMFKQDIFIESRQHRNRAFEGDEVVIELLNHAGTEKHDVLSASLQQLSLNNDVQYRGRVVGIDKSAHLNSFPGTLASFSARIALFIPSDKKVPFAYLFREEWPASFLKAYEEEQRDKNKKKQESIKNKKKLKDQLSSDSLQTTSEYPPSAPIDSSDPDPFRQAANGEHKILDSHLYLMSFDEWKEWQRQPTCHIAKTIGLSGDIISETEALLCANGIDYDHEGKFSQKILNEVSMYGEDWKIPADEIAKRRDFRSYRVMSIDPTTARDLDDAIHIVKIEDDVWEIGVHIADVSHFVKPGTALDAEAKHRATTVYLVQRAIPMLPPILCEQLCSLNPNVDRLAFSCLFYMNRRGELLDRKPWFGKSIIRTCCRLDYQTAQLAIEHPCPSDREIKEQDLQGELRECMKEGSWLRPTGHCTIDQMIRDVKLLNEIAIGRRAIRFENGSLSLHNVKLQFQCDADYNPIDFFTYHQVDSNRLVEEMMLLANMLVAAQCAIFCQDIALLRNHPPPSSRAMERVEQLCKELGYPIDAQSAGSIQRSLESFQQITIGDGSVKLRQVLEPLVTRPMNVAKYFCTGAVTDVNMWKHYALAFDHYTHFTSPIRRYADVIVHRVLSYSLLLEQYKTDSQLVQQQPTSAKPVKPRLHAALSKENVIDIAENCNNRKLAAKKAQEQCSKVYLCDFILKYHTPPTHPALCELAIITDMADRSFEILVPKLGIEKRINLEDIEGVKTVTIFPLDAEKADQRKQEKKKNNKNNNDSNTSSVSVSSSSSSTSAAAPHVMKSDKTLQIQWLDGTTQQFKIFSSLFCELFVRRGPPMDIDLRIVRRVQSSASTSSNSSLRELDDQPVQQLHASITPAAVALSTAHAPTHHIADNNNQQTQSNSHAASASSSNSKSTSSSSKSLPPSIIDQFNDDGD